MWNVQMWHVYAEPVPIGGCGWLFCCSGIRLLHFKTNDGKCVGLRPAEDDATERNVLAFSTGALDDDALHGAHNVLAQCACCAKSPSTIDPTAPPIVSAGKRRPSMTRKS